MRCWRTNWCTDLAAGLFYVLWCRLWNPIDERMRRRPENLWRRAVLFGGGWVLGRTGMRVWWTSFPWFLWWRTLGNRRLRGEQIDGNDRILKEKCTFSIRNSYIYLCASSIFSKLRYIQYDIMQLKIIFNSK